MPDFSLGGKSTRVLLLGLPVLAAVCLVLFTLIEQQYQATIRRGWSIYLEKQTHQGGPTYLGSFIGKGKGTLAIDKAGKIWVTGLGEGLQFLEG